MGCDLTGVSLGGETVGSVGRTRGSQGWGRGWGVYLLGFGRENPGLVDFMTRKDTGHRATASEHNR